MDALCLEGLVTGSFFFPSLFAEAIWPPCKWTNTGFSLGPHPLGSPFRQSSLRRVVRSWNGNWFYHLEHLLGSLTCAVERLVKSEPVLLIPVYWGLPSSAWDFPNFWTFFFPPPLFSPLIGCVFSRASSIPFRTFVMSHGCFPRHFWFL